MTKAGVGVGTVIVIALAAALVLPRHDAGIALGVVVIAVLLVAGEGIGGFDLFMSGDPARKAEVTRGRIAPRERVGDGAVYDEDAWESAKERRERE